MARHPSARPLAVAALLAAALAGACTNSGTEAEGTNQAPALSGRGGPASDQNPVGASPDQAGRTRAEAAGAIGPGNTAGTSNVNPVTQSTKTQVDTIPDTRPDAGPGSQ